MHAQLPSLARDPAPFMQANTTPMPTHPPVVDAPELQPGSIARSLHMAWMLQMELVGCRRSLTATKRPIHPNASQRFFDLMATAGSEVIFDGRRDRDMAPAICIPSHSQSSLHQLPPPFLARFQGKHPWKMLWKAPSFPWSSMLQHWVMVDWFAGVQGQANVGPERDHIYQEHGTSTPPQQPRPVLDGRQGVFIEAASPLVAPTAAQPGPRTNRERLMKAIQLQRQLLSGRLSPPGGVAPVHSTTSHTILRMMATATSVVHLNHMLDEHAVSVICLPCGGQSSLPELPPPFLVRIRGNKPWEMLLKASSFPWSSLLQLWEMVVWRTEAPGGHVVLWLRAAASTGSSAHGPTSLHTPQALTASPRPPLYTPPQQGQDAQLTATARQIPAVGRQAATPSVATPAPPCGPGPKEGRQDCSVQAPAIMQAQLACPSGIASGTQIMAADTNAAAPVVATGPGAEQSTAAAEWKDVDESTIKKWLCKLPGMLEWQLGLRHAPVALQTTVLVQLLVEEPASLNAFGTEKAPHLDCVASHDVSNNWTLCAKTSPKTSTTVIAWVARLGPEGRAGPNSVAGFKRNVSYIVQGNAKRQCGSQGHSPSLAAGVAQPAPDQGPEEMEVAPAALPDSSALSGGAAAAAGLGTAEEGGPGPSQPAVGMAGAPDEDDPEVPQPAAAPAHAGVEGAWGCSLGASHDGLTSEITAPPCQASVEDGTAQHMSVRSNQPATLASCPAPCLALGGDSASSPEPAGGQQDGALSSDAEEVALPLSGAGLAAGPLPLPSWVSDMVNRANEVQLSLQHNPANWHRAPEPRSEDASHYLLSFISQTAPAVDWKEQSMEFVIPVVCVPHDGLPSQHQLPPPFLIRSTQDHQLAVVWQPPDWPWSSVQQHWERVVWTALTQGHMVVGLKAGGNACHEAGVSISP
ncbi:hypothetical protein QJQ45_006359 [Haematococcus lacustris]|nr:hypothetical protein QJQ45_006359 [Haematococcus lacustris]